MVNKLSKTSASSSLPKIEFEDIISGEGRLNKDVSTKFDNRKGILFNENNILYGKLRPYLKNWLYTDFKGIALGDFWVFEANYIEPKFLYFLIQADIYQKAANDTSGTKMPRSDWQKVSSTKFYVPRDLEEQIKIGNLLMGIEETITLLQRKIDNLKKVKKGLLQKFFPLEQSINPQVRFSGFNQDWEQRNISEISKVFIGLVTTMTSNYSDKGTLLIRNSDIKDGYFEFNEKPIYLTEEFANKNISRMHQVGDVITVHTGDVGTSAVINEKEKNSIGFATIVTRPNQNILSPDFLSTFLNTSRHKNWALSVSTGDGRVNYNLKDYKRTMINVPSIEEQKQISSVIKNINLTITLLQKELEMNNQIKKGFLQKLFPKE